MRKKDRKWLERAAGDGLGMYPGIRCDHLPSGPRHRLLKAGLIRDWFPHNPVHLPRFIATETGDTVLEETTE